MPTLDLAVIILAAGMGTRMNSKYQKILHEVGGQPMVMHVVEAARQVSDFPETLVIGTIGGERIKNLVGESANYVVQEEQLGTGHATQATAALLQDKTNQVAVTYGDMPLLKTETLSKLAQMQAESGAAVVLTTVMGEPTSSFGRIARDATGKIQEIVEVAEAKQRPNTRELLNIRELNVGVYCFEADFLWKNIGNLPLRQARNGVEYYLTDMIGIAVEQGLLVEAVLIEEEDECLGAGTREELIAVDRAFRKRQVKKWLAAGVTIIDPDSTYIDPDVTIGKDTIIWPNSYLRGNTQIGEDCVIGPSVILTNALIEDGSTIEMQTINDPQI